MTNKLKEYFKELQKTRKHVSGKYFNEKIMRKFPGLYEEWLSSDNKNAFIYNILYDIEEAPKCIICQKPTKLRSFKKGYNKLCSSKCVSLYNKQNKNFSRKISEGMKKRYNSNYYLNKYKYVTKKEGEIFLVFNYCEHGDFWINKNKFKRVIQNNGIICEKCINEKHVVKQNNIIINKYTNERGIKFNNPYLWHKINDIGDVASFNEKKYMFNNNLKDRPLCPICKNEYRKFINSYIGYSKTCTKPLCVKSSSSQEIDIYNIIKKFCNDAVSRYKISNEEIDIFIPSLNIGVEYNGLYWHSDIFKDRLYHFKKIRRLRELGIKMFFVWEDDWNYKRDIVKSQILNLLNKSKRIYARNTIIKEVSYKDSKIFLENNHLQGSCKSLKRFGLFYDGELVSLMTFGKNRMILSNTNVAGYELLRFCNKIYYTVVGGASKLFKHFLDNYSPEKIISYANCDISDGNLYKVLGFELEEKAYPGFWWCKNGLKFHRSNFMKHMLEIPENKRHLTGDEIMKSRGFYKVWNSGNYKYIWTKT